MFNRCIFLCHKCFPCNLNLVIFEINLLLYLFLDRTTLLTNKKNKKGNDKSKVYELMNYCNHKNTLTYDKCRNDHNLKCLYISYLRYRKNCSLLKKCNFMKPT